MALLSFLWSLLALMINYGETFKYFFRESFFTLSREKFFRDSKANRTNLGILNIQALNLALHIFSLENRRNASFYRTGFWRLKVPTLFSNWHNLPNCVSSSTKVFFLQDRTWCQRLWERKGSWILFWISVTKIVQIFKKHTKEFSCRFFGGRVVKEKARRIFARSWKKELNTQDMWSFQTTSTVALSSLFLSEQDSLGIFMNYYFLHFIQ